METKKKDGAIDTKAMNIFEKIQAVSNEVRNVEKNLVVGTGNSSYKAVGDLDVVMKVKEAETKFRVVSIPVRQELVKSEIVRVVGNNGYEKLTYSDIVKMTVKIVNLDNTSETLEVVVKIPLVVVPLIEVPLELRMFTVPLLEEPIR